MFTRSIRKSLPLVRRRGLFRVCIYAVIVAGSLTFASCTKTKNAEPSSDTSAPPTTSTTLASRAPSTPSPGEYPSEPTGGDQASAEAAVRQGYVKKLARCYATRNAVASIVEINWLDFRQNQKAAGIIKDANPGLGGYFTATYEDGRWYIEYVWC